MNKGQVEQRRVLARQVAVELPESSLAMIGQEGGRPVNHFFSTCDGGVLTHDPGKGRDCTGTPDDIGI